MQINQLTDAIGDDFTPFKSLSVWRTDLESISAVQWHAVYGKIKTSHGRKKAADAMITLAEEYMKAHILNDAPYCDLLSFRIPKGQPSSIEIIAAFDDLHWSEQSAVMLAIIEEKDIEDVIRMQWKDVHSKSWSRDARDIFESTPRHLFTSHVFWMPNHDDQPRPLNHLRCNIFKSTGLGWRKFADSVRQALASFY